MGRYWTTQTGKNGKFCFAFQPSNAPEQFGMQEDQSHIEYIISKEDFNINRLNELLKEENLKTIDSYSKKEIDKLIQNYYNNHQDCDLFLGLNIYLDLLEDDFCYLEAEL